MALFIDHTRSTWFIAVLFISMLSRGRVCSRGFSSVSKSFEKLKHTSLIQSQGFINGQFTAGSASANDQFMVTNPSNGDVLARLPRMKAVDVVTAAEAANSAWADWKLTTANERSKLLMKMSELMQRHRDDLALILTLEAGKPLAEAKGELQYAISFLDFYAEECKRVHGEILQSPSRSRRIMTLRQPVGPAALITPWNFPSAMITRKLGPALAAGCTVVIKPPNETPLSALAICAIAVEAGIPPGVINCLTVDRTDVEDVGRALCHSSLIRKVSFTGSTNVGKWLMREAASTVKKVSLELGGNAPFIVFDDCDLDMALSALMSSKFRNAGQACIASNRVLVQEGIYDRFAEMVTAATQKLKIGDGLRPESTVGPLINAQGLSKVSNQVKDCVEKGAKVLTGGKEVHELNANGGFFYEPTVLVNVTKEMLPYTQETFGPVVPLMRFKTEDEAIALANDTPFGLSAYFCTNDLSRAWYIAEALEVGIVGINEGAVSLASTPFGGWKESGLGREGGHWGIDEYLEDKYVCMGLKPRRQ